MEPKEIAKKFLECYKNNKSEEIIPFISNLFDDETETLKTIVSVQIQIKELGGGWPPIGKQISTMDEIFAYSDLAIKYALDKGDKLTAGKLNHNVASFCFPNMDDGVDKKFIEPGYQAAVKDLELRKAIGEKTSMLWSMWMVGLGEFLKGNTDDSIKTLEETVKIALQEPKDKGLAAWADMMKLKFQIKTRIVSKEKTTNEIERIEAIFTEQDDSYGLSTLKGIKELK